MTNHLDQLWANFETAIENNRLDEALKVADEVRSLSEVAAQEMELRVTHIERGHLTNEEMEI
jgi:hypothetical protein